MINRLKWVFPTCLTTLKWFLHVAVIELKTWTTLKCKQPGSLSQFCCSKQEANQLLKTMQNKDNSLDDELFRIVSMCYTANHILWTGVHSALEGRNDNLKEVTSIKMETHQHTSEVPHVNYATSTRRRHPNPGYFHQVILQNVHV